MADTTLTDARYRQVRNVTLAGSVIDLLLGVGKIVVGYGAHSQALVADGIHSLSDLATDFLVIFASKHAHRKADATHPYGHGRIETLTTIALGITLLAVAIGIAWDAGRRLFEPELLLKPGPMALVAAAVSILAKEAIYHYTMHAARRLRSGMLRANAWHSRSDAISSIVVLVGVAGTMAGLPYLDAIAAIGVALMIAKIAWDLSWKSARELIDTALDAEDVAAIRSKIVSVHGVRELHMLRTRRSGSDALVDVHLLVDPTLSVSEGHQIGEKVRQTLIDDIEDVADVTVHIDPEDDETSSPCDKLPLRDEILGRLEERWASEGVQDIRDVTLHYLDGKIHVDVVLPLAIAPSPEEGRRIADRLKRIASGLKEVGEVRVYYT
jgi:cation diffusion facilitator family transporter